MTTLVHCRPVIIEEEDDILELIDFQPARHFSKFGTFRGLLIFDIQARKTNKNLSLNFLHSRRTVSSNFS
jgi:hypothetical protein